LSELDVVVVGELNVDMIMQGMTSFPEMGKEKTAPDMLLTLGSASALLASNIARLGLKVGFVGKLGKDHFGAIVLAALKDRQVDCSGIVVDEQEKTGITVAMTFPDDYAMVTYLGAMERVTLADVDFKYVARGRHLHHSSIFLMPSLRPGLGELFRRARDAGLTTSFDPNWDPTEEWGQDVVESLKYVDVFLPNDGEATNLTGAATPEEALDILSQYARIVVIKLGSEGAICSAGGQKYRVGAFKVEPVDTTGAGDSFNAGFLSRWLKDGDVKAALLSGVACGALAVTRMGGTEAMPTVAEMEAFLKAHPEDIFRDHG